ncbi:MAG: 50S ribosomal protein L11 methyltransferase, partial [Gammaproteobacteria bacterium]|nr:50S ribosomal protein L11 methyltransferase [Gammaproteobacteria bacterium]
GATNIEVGGVDAVPHWRADVLVANILLAPLVTLAPTFAGLVRQGGMLVLAGILADQVDECLAAYAPFFTMGAVRYDDEWALLSGERNTVAADAAAGAAAGGCGPAAGPDSGPERGRC